MQNVNIKALLSISNLLGAVTNDLTILAKSLTGESNVSPQVNRMRKIEDRKSNVRLSSEDKVAIGRLLADSSVPVPIKTIAKMYNVSRPSIYNLRDKLGLRTHRRASHSFQTAEKAEKAVA